MNAVVAVSLVCLITVFGISAETYPEEYDKLDIDTLLRDANKMKSFGECLLDEAACSERASKLKGILLDAFKTKCSKCTEIQKGYIRKTVKYFYANHPELWQKVEQTYDPEGIRADGFKKFILGD